MLIVVILCGTVYYLKHRKAHGMGGHRLDIFGYKTKTPKLGSNKKNQIKWKYFHHSSFQPLLH